MKKFILILIVIALVIFFATRNSSEEVQNEEMMMDSTSEEMMDESMEGDMEMGEETSMDDSSDMEGEVAGSYEAYSADKLAFADEGNVVIFFRASWCPSCKALDEDIKESLGDIPADLVILDADYDAETELKQKYEVTTQHSLVQVDSEGNMIQKWAGGSTLESIVEKL
jgi:thiol-disulfide isomerase/thioredoxin